MKPDFELDEEDRTQLIEWALEARSHAYAPYSRFLVGASVLTQQGSLFHGCNVENASLGLTICAERVAMGSAISAGFQRFRAICVVSEGGVAPCGACRQFIREFGGDTVILLVDADERSLKKETTIGQLLPDSFSLKS